MVIIFDRRVICIYDYSGWANVMEYHIYRIGTYVPVGESYTFARSVLETDSFADLIRICIAFWEHIRMRILYDGYTYDT